MMGKNRVNSDLRLGELRFSGADYTTTRDTCPESGRRAAFAPRKVARNRVFCATAA
jgi:hypothetical protein